jgi:hypothetical protein
MSHRLRVRRVAGSFAATLIICGTAYAALPDGHGAIKAAAVRKPASPRPLSPPDGSTRDAMPAFSWAPVRKAATYEFELSADGRFNSTVQRIKTPNTYATLDKTLTDGTYHWRVRTLNAHNVAGPWSRARIVMKSWQAAPVLLSPARGAAVSYPATPLVLRWSTVPHAYRYRLRVATDPSLASIAPGLGGKATDTSGTTFALPTTLAPGTYYWGVVPLDSEGRPGAGSAVSSFTWVWPTQTSTSVADTINPAAVDAGGLPEVLSPQLSWAAIPGAARYEVELNPADDFAPGSRVCCTGLTNAATVSPTSFLPNNVFHWRIRAFDLDGNAGDWNVGPDFRKQFDDVAPAPAISGLELRDAQNNLLSSGDTTDSPVLRWNTVTGAAAYKVVIAPWTGTDCDFGHPKFTVTTANTAWTPLPNDLSNGGSYCARLSARTDDDLKGVAVTSDFVQWSGWFKYQLSPLPGPNPPVDPPNYLSMQTGSGTAVPPVFRWDPIAGASNYHVLIARDALFTTIVENVVTNATAYAPRADYKDENTHYYWVVMPAGTTCLCDWHSDDPQSFDKASNPPAPVGPVGGTAVNTQPTFRWAPAVGAKTYRLQVAQDMTFSDPIDDVTTDSTSYTSLKTYPADTVLYWRVRANDWNDNGLNWSPPVTFRRLLPTPTLNADNPTASPDVPLIRWSAVPGATSYTFQVEQGNGSTDSSNVRNTALTPTSVWGTGNVRFHVRANFPNSGNGETSGPFSDFQTFTLQIPPVPGVSWTRRARALLLSWNPSNNAGTKKYKVEISTTNSFSTLVDNHTTENTSYAPQSSKALTSRGPLYWRVATVDEKGAVGAWTTRVLSRGSRMRIKASGRLRARRRSLVKVKVTNSRGAAIAGAKVNVTGIGFRTVAKRTGKRGTVTFRLHPTRSGVLAFIGSKPGYQSGRATLRVR